MAGQVLRTLRLVAQLFIYQSQQGFAALEAAQIVTETGQVARGAELAGTRPYAGS